MPQRYIQVAVVASLPSEQCVNSPSAIHPDDDSVRAK